MSDSVGFNPDKPRAPYPVRLPVFAYARPDAKLPHFPAGFELKIVGPAKDRKVMIRTMLMAHYRSTFGAQQGFVTTAARF